MAERQVEKRELFWSVVWMGAALLGALLVLVIVARLDGMAAGLVFAGVTFMVLSCLFTFYLMPPEAQIEKEVHAHDEHAGHGHADAAHAHGDTGHGHVHDAPAAAVPLPAAGPVASPAAVDPVAVPVTRDAVPAPAAAPAQPVGIDTPFSERVRDAARAAGEAARAAVAEPEPSRVVAPAKPSGLDAAPDGGGDNLKKINGVGPKFEALLHGLGVYHFSQIAVWGPGEVAWVDENIEGFRGRIVREDWVGQAKLLAGGGETDFSKRVDRGEVY